ncbi:MAG: beta strand repeat-containing protein, partial [Pseudomonas sp.]
LSGSTLLGGDSQLEVQTGEIETGTLDLSGHAGTFSAINGTDGNDTLEGTVDNDTIFGGGGSDQITGSGGDDWLEGGDETDFAWSGDSIQGGPGNDTILGGAGADNLYGNSGNDNLVGGDGDDYLSESHSEGNDTLRGGAGNDTFSIQTGWSGIPETDLAFGGDGNDLFDVIIWNPNGSVIVEGGAGTDTFKVSQYFYNKSWTVTDFATGMGGDVIDVSSLLDASAGGTFGYTGGNPFATGSGYLSLVQSGADAWLQWDKDGLGTNYSNQTVLVLQEVNKSNLTFKNFLYGIDPSGGTIPGLSLTGSAAADTLAGSYFNDTIFGGGGSDQITGSGGDDWLEGGDETDFAWSGDSIQGGPGNDTILGGAGADNLYGNSGNDNLVGGDGDDYLSESHSEGNDTLRGGAGNDTFSIQTGWSGIPETDLAFGGDGNDLFDVIIWNPNGSVIVEGGAGTDTFKVSQYFYNKSWTVTDFATGMGGDVIDVSSLLDASAGGTFGYTGGNPMRFDLGYLRLEQSGSDTLLQWDKDGAAQDGYGYQTTLTLVGIQSSSISAYNFKPLTIEGTAGADTLEGGLGVDTLSGFGGDDILNGNWGDDSMTGGTGNDTYYVDNLGDLVKEVAGEGVDKVVATIDYIIAGNVENLVLGSGASKGTGNALDNVMQANDAGNELVGGEGKDILYAGKGNDRVDAGDGDDLIVGGGGAGNNTYVGGAGADTVRYTSVAAKVTVNLSAGTASGADIGTDILSQIENIIGGKSDDSISGSSGNNVLNGYTGADTMIGGLGDDIYYVDNASDVVSESSDTTSGGIDTIISTVTRTLGNFQEKLTLSGAVAINGTGNNLANTLLGNSAANVLNGSIGADTMVGGLGNDTYYVDNAADVVSEVSSTGGVDTVIASVNRLLGNYQENLVLSGTAAINGTGNSLANTLTGNSAANVLNGSIGADTMVGGLGNDT